MRIQFLNGGLANQVFQYIFVRFAELYQPTEQWYFDDSFFWVNQVHNGYELEKVFGIKANLLSQYFDEDVWEEVITRKKNGISLPQTFLDMGIPISMLAETTNYSKFNPFSGEVIRIGANEFHPEVTKIARENLYYHGYWINKQWLESYHDIICRELQFPIIEDERNTENANRIKNSLSVGIHVRRGDFVKLGYDIPLYYYKDSCKQFLNEYPMADFFVFSDDIEWCKQNDAGMGLNLASKTTYVSGNMEGNNYRDLQLLSMCRGMIMSNSSFCYLAALLDHNLDFFINPTKREI